MIKESIAVAVIAGEFEPSAWLRSEHNILGNVSFDALDEALINRGQATPAAGRSRSIPRHQSKSRLPPWPRSDAWNSGTFLAWGARAPLFLFSLLSMGQIAFVAHIVSLFLEPLIVWQDHLIHGMASALQRKSSLSAFSTPILR